MRALLRGLAAFAAAAAMWSAAPAVAQYSAFYAATRAELAAGPPGSIIRSQQIYGSPWGSTAYRVLYRSTGLDGQMIATSGVVVVPQGNPPAGGFPVIAWAHPTTGVADKCAPSLSLVNDVFATIHGLDLMVQKGFAVAATDYPGLGTAGDHPYLVGPSEANAVLDSVRALRQMGGSSRFAVWGHSQGGHAALWTGELAAQYAPDLQLVGVAAAAPASLLGQLFDDDLGTDAGKGLTALTLWSWSHIYNVPMQSVVEAEDLTSVAAIGGECLAGFTDLATDATALAHINQGKFLTHDPVRTEPWADIVSANTPGKLPLRVPVFIAQGTADTIVDPPVTTKFADELCKQGVSVTFHRVPDATHTVIAKVSATAAVNWMERLFAGQSVENDCRSN